ncbi:NAD(P)-dependent oxidoreductase [Microbacterium sp. W4I20]|uniref:NAD-dependent epimerase/dehydratase family protein n=1 Tax=Microbacterium sp. W4I20 TaxID=3042262 RepID=UPI0027845DF8|nr:NAD(P)-dependent oxidoreductase [Microbacterium sp. W4I20]MDQ0727603.1 nucleoside-diphosphate-sugar epimerase [Microbacterium sp. W4I20]
MKLLIIGGGGHLGRLIGPTLAESHLVKVADRMPDLRLGWATTIEVDVLDQDALTRAAEGMDAIVYMAMGTKEGWGSPAWARSQFDVNVTGLYNALQAAARADVRRVVIAGSLSVFDAFLSSTDDSTPDAVDAYGLSKRLGEDVARAAATEHGLHITILRLVLPMADDVWLASSDDKHAIVMTSASDTAAAFGAAVLRDEPGCTAMAITGDHQRRHLDWSRAERLLGWQPQSRRPRDAAASSASED